MTAAPDFGFSLALRRGPGSTPLDLSALRVCITGAEPVRAETLRRFAAAFVSHGFAERISTSSKIFQSPRNPQ